MPPCRKVLAVVLVIVKSGAGDTTFTTDEAALSRAEFAELQTLLRLRGHCAVVADGRDGPRTRSAIEAEETLSGRTPTGRGGARLLAALQGLVGQDAVTPAVCDASGPD